MSLPISTKTLDLKNEVSLAELIRKMAIKLCDFNGHYKIEIKGDNTTFQLDNYYYESIEPQVFDLTIVDVMPKVLHYWSEKL